MKRPQTGVFAHRFDEQRVQLQPLVSQHPADAQHADGHAAQRRIAAVEELGCAGFEPSSTGLPDLDSERFEGAAQFVLDVQELAFQEPLVRRRTRNCMLSWLFTCTRRNQPMRIICAIPRGSFLSVLLR